MSAVPAFALVERGAKCWARVGGFVVVVGNTKHIGTHFPVFTIGSCKVQTQFDLFVTAVF